MIDKLRQMAQAAKQDGSMVCVSPETIEQLLDERDNYRAGLKKIDDDDDPDFYGWFARKILSGNIEEVRHLMKLKMEDSK